MEQDIRWKQRLSTYQTALDKLRQSVAFIHENLADVESAISEQNVENTLNEMMKEGLIQRFEYTHELAWNLMKDYAIFQGNTDVQGSRDASREAFRLGLVEDGHTWMDMIKARNLTSHTYNEETANTIYTDILTIFFPALDAFEKRMMEIATHKGS